MKNSISLCIATSIFAISGCTSLTGIMKPSFNESVAQSQAYVQKAVLLIESNNYTEAKIYLDEAYLLFPRQAALHEQYLAYYTHMNDLTLMDVARARYKSMLVKSDTLQMKGFYAMSKMESNDLARQLFSLSLIYNQENTRTLTSIAALGYTTNDIQLANTALKILKQLNFKSPESTMLDYLVAERLDDQPAMKLAKLTLYTQWPTSPQLKLIEKNYIG